MKKDYLIVADILKNRRLEQGYLNLDIPESKIILDENGKVLEVKHNGKEEGLFGIPSGGGIVKAKATIMSSNKEKETDTVDILVKENTNISMITYHNSDTKSLFHLN